MGNEYDRRLYALEMYTTDDEKIAYLLCQNEQLMKSKECYKQTIDRLNAFIDKEEELLKMSQYGRNQAHAFIIAGELSALEKVRKKLNLAKI